jgi:hypothetical protein
MEKSRSFVTGTIVIVGPLRTVSIDNGVRGKKRKGPV